MPRKPKHPCSYPGCPELTEGRYCKAHQKEMDREYNKKKWIGNTTEAIDHIRNYITAVDGKG